MSFSNKNQGVHQIVELSLNVKKTKVMTTGRVMALELAIKIQKWEIAFAF